ncbi:FG-GAP repeat [Carpediemonas membranifera]|uniref:FG-GAP repeat n=1 Tax=Carpediemonas membranifera TaxID=201153 RepID=A0A8J6ATL7_9EUKA|nr:FG-GAP repeat [Carpediemonas membranifera]|eukprot:KAG9394276.1 FG-GAP repeat [Carpediemonas membranifera]
MRTKVLFGLLLCVSATFAAAITVTETQRWEPETVDPNYTKEALFSVGLAMSGSLAVVGQYGFHGYRGKAFLYELVGGVWTYSQELAITDANIGFDLFGFDACINGTTAIYVSSRGDGYAPSDTYIRTGAIFVFEPTGPDSTWVQTGKILPDERVKDASFSYPIVIHGDMLVTGSTNYNTVRGAAYVFRRSDTGEMTQEQLITYSDDSVQSYFGCSVSIDGDYMAIGAYAASAGAVGGNSYEGKVRIFHRNEAAWDLETTLYASIHGTSASFGMAVGLVNDTLVVGAPNSYDDIDKSTQPGAVYVFQRNGTDWVETDILFGDGEDDSAFGLQRALAFDGRTLVVGAHQSADDVRLKAGKTFVYQRSHDNWIQTQRLMSSAPLTGAGQGYRIALDNGHLISGAYHETITRESADYREAGAAYYFDLTAGYCPPGTFNDAGTCTDCPDGTYQADWNQPSCNDVEIGYYSTDWLTQTACNDGKFSNATGLASCYLAEPGYFVPADGEAHTEQLPCTADAAYTNTSGNSACNTAEAGYYVADEDRTKQVPCDGGKFQPDGGQTTCVETATKGHYVPADGKPHTTEEDCPAGHYCPTTGMATPEACAAGTFSADTAQDTVDTCAACTAGSYCGGEGLAATSGDCSAGYFCISGATTASPTDGDTGDICPVGSYCPAGSTSSTPCTEVGSYTNATGKEACDVADEGFFVDPTDHTKQQPCNAGKYQPATGKSSCETATKGHYVPADGKPHTTEEDCPAGHYCPTTGMATPEACAAGTFSADTAQDTVDTCAACTAGSYCGGEGLAATSGDCSAGYFCISGATTASPTDGDTGDICPVGSYCPAGSTSSTPCTEVGSYTNATGKEACDVADEGFFVDPTDHTKQQPCNAGKYQPATGKSSCETATKGHYVPEGSIGYTAQQSCVVGTFANETAMTACIIAEAGYYVPSPEATDQLACSAEGAYTNSTGSKSCETATAGWYVNSTDHTKQLTCDGGEYQDETGRGECKTCPAQHSTANDGRPHTVCTAWVSPVVAVNTTTPVTLNLTNANSNVSDATIAIGGETAPCVLMPGPGSAPTTVVPVVSTPTVAAGTYTMTFQLEDGSTETTSITLSQELTIPTEGEVSFSGTSATNTVSSPMCPSKISSKHLSPASFSGASVSGSDVQCKATQSVTPKTIKSSFMPSFKLRLPGMASALTTPTSTVQVCVALTDATFSSTEGINITVSGTPATTVFVADGMVCTLDVYDEDVIATDADTFVTLAGTTLVAAPTSEADSSTALIVVVAVGLFVLAAVAVLTAVATFSVFMVVRQVQKKKAVATAATQLCVRMPAPPGVRGFGLAMSGSLAVVGQYGFHGYRGKAFLYELVGGVWTYSQELAITDANIGFDLFGFDACINGTTAIYVSSRGDGYAPSDTYIRTGAIFVFEPTGPDSTWVQTGKILPDERVKDASFSYPIVIHGDMLVTGSTNYNTVRGAAYVFRWSRTLDKALSISDRAVYAEFHITDCTYAQLIQSLPTMDYGL